MSVPYDGTVMTAKPASGGRADAGQNSAGQNGAGQNSAGQNSAGQHSTGRPVLTAVLGAACISSSAILVTLAHAGDATTAFYRCALALPMLVPIAVLEQRRLGPRPLSSRRNALIAGLFLAVDLVLWNHAIADVGAGVATVLGNLQVLFVAAFAWLVLRERPGRRYLAMLPVVLAGVILVSGMLGGQRAGLHPLAGVGFGLATSAAYACFLLTLRTTGGRTPHVAGQLADATVGAAIGSAVLGLLFGGFQLHIPWPSVGWLLMLAVLSGTAGWLLITSSLPRLPAAMSSLLLLLQPAGALVLAAVVLREQPTIMQVIGAVVVCLGVLAASSTRGSGGRRDRPEPEPAVALQHGRLGQARTANST